ncbi:MAG: sensor domain-containing diguanylate cyclase [Spirochaetales bacterium]|nr:sensor domain-containing diguanylate cyclase [Spirochaetales bacterium]
MLKNSFILVYFGLTALLILVTYVTSIIGFPLNALIQSVSLFIVMSVFFIFIRKKFKPILIIFQKTLKDVAKNDLTLDKDDLKNIEAISNFTLSNPIKILKYTNRLLKNQNTILETACNDRDYINKSKKLQDTIINLNHSIVATKKTETLLDEILETAIATIDGSVAGSVMIPRSDGSAKYVSSIGMDLEELQKISIKIEDTFVYKINKKNEFKPVIIRDKPKFNKEHLPGNIKLFESSGSNEYPCSLSAPIVIDNTIYGVLCLDSRSTNAFNKDDLRMMEYFTSEMAIVIKNSRLINKAIQLSQFDSLTNIHNRHFFEEIARMAFEEASRYKGQLHIVLFDLDNFKSVNDTHGHACGDKVLKKFSDTISNSIRGSDVFARFGGDEFIALFRNSNTKNIEKRITGIKKELNDSPLKTGDKEYNIKFSYGIAGFPDNGVSLQELLKAADINMYKNKDFNKKN